MKDQVPGVLLIAIVTGALLVVFKIGAAFFFTPLMLIDAVIWVVIVAGLYSGKKWAYVLTLVLIAIGVLFGLSQSVRTGLMTLVVDSLVLIPVLLSTAYFFPEDRPLPRATNS